MAKKECFDNKKIGWMFKKIGCLPVDRTKVNHKTLKLTLAILKNNGAIGIFPEGTRNKTENLLLPFKPGAIELAQRTNAYIVPFGITGEYKFRSKNLKIEFGQPFKIDNITLQEANLKLFKEIEMIITNTDKNIGNNEEIYVEGK